MAVVDDSNIFHAVIANYSVSLSGQNDKPFLFDQGNSTNDDCLAVLEVAEIWFDVTGGQTDR